MEWDKENYDAHAQSFSNDPPFSAHGSGSSSKSPLSDITRSQMRIHTPTSLAQSSYAQATQDSDLVLQKTSFSFSIYDENCSFSFPPLADELLSLPCTAVETVSSETEPCSYSHLPEQDSLLALGHSLQAATIPAPAPAPTPTSVSSTSTRISQPSASFPKNGQRKSKAYTFFR